EIHSTSWEWDMAGLSAQWRHSHNYRHHVYTNVLGLDDDIGFGVMRVTRDERWQPGHLLQPLRNLLLAVTFEWGIASQGWYLERKFGRTAAGGTGSARALAAKIARQVAKDYVVFPALSGRRWRRTLTANAMANLVRNLWAYTVIACGQYPDGAERFAPEVMTDESRAHWYLRQMLGTANWDAGPVLAFLSGHLSHQIEHHLCPALPGKRYPQLAVRVRALCEKYE